MLSNLHTTTLACALLLAAAPTLAQDATPADSSDARNDAADVAALTAQLQALKADYAQEIRRLRALDVQVRALQARLVGKATPGTQLPAVAASATPPAAETARTTAAQRSDTVAGSPEEARHAQSETHSRSLQDALQQEHALFDRKLTLENSLSYSRYDRKQLTLNGFLALDAIFLGNIAIENVEADTLTYDFAARYGLNPRLTLNLDVPYLARQSAYQKGGAGGSAATVAEERTTGAGIGDVSLSANYKLFSETAQRPDTVLTLGLTAPTGREPYGIDWRVLERDDDKFIRFAVPARQPTGNGLWQANIAMSAVKTMDPAIIFANVGYIYSLPRSFGDIDTDPDTRTPGRVKLGDAYYFGAGVAFAFNERTSMSLSFSDRFTTKASLRQQGAAWSDVIGSDANAATFNLGLTYALSPRTTFVALLGMGLTPDAPDFNLTFRVPYMF